MNKRLTLEEQELHIWITAAERDLVHVEVGIPRYRKQIERQGHKPETINEFGVATFRLPVAAYSGFRRGKRRSTPELDVISSLTSLGSRACSAC